MSLKDKLSLEYLTHYQRYSETDGAHAPFRWGGAVLSTIVGGALLASNPDYSIYSYSGILCITSTIVLGASLMIDVNELQKREQEEKYKNDLMRRAAQLN